jgi:biopolymer transport protein ExbB
MKKYLVFALSFLILSSQVNLAFAQNAPTSTDTSVKTTTPDSALVDSAKLNAAAPAAPKKEKKKMSFHQVIKTKFIEGTPAWMTPVLICLLLGLAVVIERIITLYLAGTNTQKFVGRIEDILKSKGVEAAKEECRNTNGPVASIFYQGLDRIDEGIAQVEAAVVSYGSVQLGQLEKGLVWISLFIALAPMLGFLGTVVGMIGAFDDIQSAGDISPTIVAGGIKVALLTTVAGLIVAIILQIFYNLILSKVDSISNEMEEASISLTDILIKNKLVQVNKA